MVVEQGGVGPGTVIRFTMRLLGRTQRFRTAVTEPELGRVLAETDLETNDAVTSFIVDPGPGSGQSQVTITTSLNLPGGIRGKMERFLSTKLLYPIYVWKLELLALGLPTVKKVRHPQRFSRLNFGPQDRVEIEWEL